MLIPTRFININAIKMYSPRIHEQKDHLFFFYDDILFLIHIVNIVIVWSFEIHYLDIVLL